MCSVIAVTLCDVHYIPFPALLLGVVFLTGLVKPTNMVCSCLPAEPKNLQAMSVSVL